MAKPKVFPRCSAILEFKREIGSEPTEVEKLRSQALVNFILWIVEENHFPFAKQRFTMSEDGEVSHPSISLEDYILKYLSRNVEEYLKISKQTKSPKYFATFRCNFKKVLEYLVEKNLSILNIDELFPLELVEPSHPLLESYLASFEVHSVALQRKYRLKAFLVKLLGIEPTAYRDFWSKERIEEEKAVVEKLRNCNGHPTSADKKTSAYQILFVSQSQLEKILKELAQDSPAHAKYYRSAVRLFYQWLRENKLSEVTVGGRSRIEIAKPKTEPKTKPKTKKVATAKNPVKSGKPKGKFAEKKVVKKATSQSPKSQSPTSQSQAKPPQSDIQPVMGGPVKPIVAVPSAKRLTSKAVKDLPRRKGAGDPNKKAADRFIKSQDLYKEQKIRERQLQDAINAEAARAKRERQKREAEERNRKLAERRNSTSVKQTSFQISVGYAEREINPFFLKWKIKPILREDVIAETKAEFHILRDYLMYALCSAKVQNGSAPPREFS